MNRNNTHKTTNTHQHKPTHTNIQVIRKKTKDTNSKFTHDMRVHKQTYTCTQKRTNFAYAYTQTHKHTHTHTHTNTHTHTQTHTHTHTRTHAHTLSLSLSLSLSLFPSLSHSHSLSLSLSFSFSLCLFIHLSIYLSVYLSIHLSLFSLIPTFNSQISRTGADHTCRRTAGRTSQRVAVCCAAGCRDGSVGRVAALVDATGRRGGGVARTVGVDGAGNGDADPRRGAEEA
jgi:hypothetical protein